MSTVTVGAAGAAGTFDYTCDGTADEVQILAAIADCGAGDAVQLSAGTFECAADITLTAGVNLAGTTGTVLNFAGTTPRFLYASGTNAISGFDLTGGIALRIAGDDVAVSGVTSRATVYLRACFDIRKVAGGVIENISFTDCHSIDSSGFGFEIYHYGDPAPALTVRNVTFTDCTAINCGASYDMHTAYKNYVVGFDFAEGDEYLTIENVVVENCTATGCYESGFHTEAGAIAINCRITDCTATGNGIPKWEKYLAGEVPDAPSWGAGFRLIPRFDATDCTASGNYAGIIVYYSGIDPTPDAPVRLTRCQALNSVTDALTIYGWPLSRTNAIAADCTVSGAVAPNYLLKLYHIDGAIISNLRVVDCATASIYQWPVVNSNVITYYLAPFSRVPAAPYARQEVAFTDVSANDALTTWAWDFGDGATSALQNPAHAFAAPGAYPVTLTAGGSTVARTLTVREAVVYGGVELSEADIGPLDHDPMCTATYLHNGRVRLQGSPVSRKAWTIDALADDHAEIEALAALKGQHLTLNINGVEYPGVMIRPPMLETQLTPSAWTYQIGFVQETRR